MSQQEQLFTVRVTETGGKVHIWHNLNKDKVSEMKAIIWRQGCQVKRDENTWELVSPYMLREVLIILQKGEVSGTMDNITNYGQQAGK